MAHSPACRPADNPFASCRIDLLDYRFPTGTIDDLLTGLSRSDHRGALVGPHGSGKTTLLEELADRLSGIILRIRLDSEIHRPFQTAIDALPQQIGPGHSVLIDGAEQLAPWSWWRINRRIRDAGTIVITTHQPGRLPTIFECTTHPELLRELVEELAPEVVETVDLETLFNRHNGNIRLCFRELYDRCVGSGADPTFWAADGVPASRDQFG